MIAAASRWIDRNILELARDFQLSYLPPLMVYMAAGISGLTGIVGTFFVKLGASQSIMGALYKGLIATGALSLVGIALVVLGGIIGHVIRSRNSWRR